VRVVLKADAAPIGNPIILALNTEAMQVLTAPGKDNLKIFME
jgi:hypothetical protein